MVDESKKRLEGEMKSPQFLELETLEEIVRMVITSAAPEHASLFMHEDEEGTKVFSTLLILPGWFDLRAVPILIFVRTTQEIGSGLYFRYDVFDKHPKVEAVDSLDEKELASGKVRFVPVIRVKHLPPILEVPKPE